MGLLWDVGLWGYGIWGIPQPCYDLVDLYEQCQQVGLGGRIGSLWGRVGSLWGHTGSSWGHAKLLWGVGLWGYGIWGIAQPCYDLVDLYGQCQHVGLGGPVGPL